MTLKGLATAAAALSAAFAAPALAQAPAPDAPVASARGDALDRQIAAYLADSDAPVETAPRSLAPDAPPQDRGPHGEIGAGFGSHGYREMHAAVVAPVGDRGQVAVAVGQVRGRGFAGPVDLGLVPPSPGGIAPAGPVPRRATPSCGADKPGAAPPWVERMRRIEPAAPPTAGCPSNKP